MRHCCCATTCATAIRIENPHRRAIGTARREEIIIANAYFLPGGSCAVRWSWRPAGRGVRLLLQGRYEYFMQYHAGGPVYGALPRADRDP